MHAANITSWLVLTHNSHFSDTDTVGHTAAYVFQLFNIYSEVWFAK